MRDAQPRGVAAHGRRAEQRAAGWACALRGCIRRGELRLFGLEQLEVEPDHVRGHERRQRLAVVAACRRSVRAEVVSRVLPHQLLEGGRRRLLAAIQRGGSSSAPP